MFVITTKQSLSQSVEIGTWNLINVKYDNANSISYFGEGQLRSLRFFHHFHYYEFKAGMNVKINRMLQFTLAAGTYQTYKEGGNFETPKNNDEFRFWPQITLYQDIGRFKIEQRYRAEMRWTSDGYRNRFRYRIGVFFPFGHKTKGYRPFQVGLNNELFLKDNAPYFERNRIQAIVNFKNNSHTTIQMGYLHQLDYKINDETGRNFLIMGLFYELSRKKIQ